MTYCNHCNNEQGEEAVDQLCRSQESEENPPVGEEEIHLLVPDIGWEDTAQIGCIGVATVTPGMLHTFSPCREGLGIIEY